MAESKTKQREQLYTRWGALKSERATWWAHWQEISTYLLPRNGRYFVQDHNKGHRRHNNLYDNTGTRALRTLGAGMMAGATSPARPWFRLSAPDPDLNDYHPVRLWLDDVTRRMQRAFQQSNTYRALHQIYEELGAFGTGVSLILPDPKELIHHYPITVGEYAIAQDYQGRVTSVYREFEKTVGEVVKEFGYKRCSKSVQNMYDRGSLDQWVTLIHAIEPRIDRDINKRDNMNMPYRSVYFELGGDPNQLLRESGYQSFPAVVPRWNVTGGDIYGNSPGMEALGDIKQLQHEQLRKAQAIDYQTKPPLQVPTSLKNRDVEMLPGGVSFVDGAQGIRTAFEVNLNLDHLVMDIQDVRERIRGAFYADLFLMLANATDTRMTATEVAERHEEKLLMLGPVLERLHNELLSPLIDITFERMIQANMIPPPPAELQGMDLSVEFVSMLAQAQRAIGTNSIDRYVGNLGMVAQYKPDVLDKFDADQWADVYADMLGVDPRMLIAGENLVAIRKSRQEAAAAQAQLDAMEKEAKIAKDMGAAQAAGPGPGAAPGTMDIMNQFAGYSSPSPTQV